MKHPQGIRIEVKPGPPKGGSWPVGTRNYMVTLRRGTKKITTEYHQGPGIKHEPHAEDVLEALAIDAGCGEQSYEDYLSDFGMERSFETRRIYNACARTTPKLKVFLGEDYETVLREPEKIHDIVHAKPRTTR